MIDSMITTVTRKMVVAIPAEIGRRFGIKPGFRLEWQTVEGQTISWCACYPTAANWPAGCWEPDGNFRRNATPLLN